MQEIPYLQPLTAPDRGFKPAPGSILLRELPRDAGERGSRDCRRGGERQWLARLIGRQIAREEHERPEAANDNEPAGEAGER